MTSRHRPPDVPMCCLDSLDKAELGSKIRDVVLKSFWDWYDESPEPVPSELNTLEKRLECFMYHTAWVNEISDRELGDRIVSALERTGFEISKR